MKLPSPDSFRDTSIVVLILISGLCNSGCQEETPTSCPDYAVGAIEGYLLSVGQGVSLEIRARAMEDSRRDIVVAETISDSTGYYRFDLPSGLYRLEVNSGSSYSFNYDERDTVRVRQTVRRYDLWRGRVEVQVGVPPEYEGRDCHLRLEGDSGYFYAYEPVQSGKLRYVFPFESLGSYKMELSLPDHADFFLPGTYEYSEGHSLIVGMDEVARYEIDLSDIYATVSGVVTGSWQQSQESRMEVTLHGTSPYGQFSRGRCDDDGAFTCGVFIPGPVKIRTTYGYDITQWVGGDTFETAQVFDVQPGDRLTDINVVESGIAVRVEWPGDQIGSSPRIKVRDDNGWEEELHGPGNNPYYLCNFRPGRYYVQVGRNCEDHIWAPRWFGGTEDFEEAEPIDLVAGELREISINLVEGGRIEGEIRDQDGSIHPDADFQLYHTDGVSLCAYWTNWPGSRMKFSGVPDGTYLVAARASGGRTWYHPGTLDVAEATRIVVEDHQTVSGLVWTVPEDQGATP